MMDETDPCPDCEGKGSDYKFLALGNISGICRSCKGTGTVGSKEDVMPLFTGDYQMIERSDVKDE